MTYWNYHRYLPSLGCPRNNQIFFRFEPKQSETQSVSVVFQFVLWNQKTFFSVCFGVLDQYQNNRNKQNFIETNQKNLQKIFSIRRSSKPLNFFSRFEPKQTELNLFGCFSVCFSQNPKKYFWFVLMFRTSIETTETNRTYGMGN